MCVTPVTLQVEPLVMMERDNKGALNRLVKDRCKDTSDPAWYLRLRAYWDRETDECIFKQVSTPP